jgi:signal peptidase I
VIDLFVPPTVQNGARRISTILLTLAVFVIFLFPESAKAGTEVPLDRYLTGGLLAAAGIALRVLPVHTFLILTLHGGLQLFFGATWAVVLSGGAVLYGMAALARMKRSGSAGAEDEAADDEKLHVADILKENVESIAMALIIALTCREFLYEAFLIPTASMEPTILGKDVREGRKHGDRLLATKIPMLTGDPPRWSIVVFKYPLYRRVNYIKRLVGLPGELVEIRNGDIYVNEQCVAKPEAVQNQLWFPEYPLRGQQTPLSQAVTRDDQNAEWSLTDAALSADVPSGVESRLYYDETLARSDADLCIGIDVDVAATDGDGAVLVRLDGAERRVDLRFGPGGAVLDAPGREGHELEGVTWPGGSFRLAMGVADRVVRVWVDGRLVARVPHADEANGGETMPRVSFGLTGAQASFSGMRVFRDLQYAKSRAWQVPDDGFVMLGDNTISSKDSREWRVNVVTTADGRVYEGEDIVKLEDNSQVRFRTSDDGHYEFIDVDGVFRRIPAEGSEFVADVRRPFVRRRDLVGRAFVTFFPFPPFGDARLHFLP